jgi:hypothetical protein
MTVQTTGPWLDLQEGAAALNLDLGDLPELSDVERSAALSTWRGRMLNEFVSARVFDALAGQVAAAGLDVSLVETARRFAADERRHGYMCGAVVQALGGRAVAPVRPLADVPDHVGCSPLEGVLRNVMSISCLAETVAVALITAERVQCGPASLNRVLTQILADEVRHARFGWTLLDAVAPTVDAQLRDRLSVYLELAFAHLERHELRYLPQGNAPSHRAEQVGVCDGDQSRALFYSTVHEVIVPNLQRRGYAAHIAWQQRSFARAA